MWKPTQQEALWLHGGNLHQSRHDWLYLGLQLKARSDRIGRVPALAAALVTAAVSIGRLVAAATSAVVLAAFLGTGLAYGAVSALVPAVTADRVGVGAFSFAYVRVFTGWGCAGLLAPVASGFILGLQSHQPGHRRDVWLGRGRQATFRGPPTEVSADGELQVAVGSRTWSVEHHACPCSSHRDSVERWLFEATNGRHRGARLGG